MARHDILMPMRHNAPPVLHSKNTCAVTEIIGHAEHFPEIELLRSGTAILHIEAALKFVKIYAA